MITKQKPQPDNLGIDELIGEKRSAVLRLAEQYGAYNVRVFGSAARGQAHSKRDIDLLVDWDYERVGSRGSAELRDELKKLLQREVDILSAKWLDPMLRDQILKDAVPL